MFLHFISLKILMQSAKAKITALNAFYKMDAVDEFTDWGKLIKVTNQKNPKLKMKFSSGFIIVFNYKNDEIPKKKRRKHLSFVGLKLMLLFYDAHLLILITTLKTSCGTSIQLTKYAANAGKRIGERQCTVELKFLPS